MGLKRGGMVPGVFDEPRSKPLQMIHALIWIWIAVTPQDQIIQNLRDIAAVAVPPNVGTPAQAAQLERANIYMDNLYSVASSQAIQASSLYNTISGQQGPILEVPPPYPSNPVFLAESAMLWAVKATCMDGRAFGQDDQSQLNAIVTYLLNLRDLIAKQAKVIADYKRLLHFPPME